MKQHVDFAAVFYERIPVKCGEQPFTPRPGLKIELTINDWSVASLVMRKDGSWRVIDHKVGPVSPPQRIEADPHNPNAHVRAGCDHRVSCKVFPQSVKVKP